MPDIVPNKTKFAYKIQQPVIIVTNRGKNFAQKLQQLVNIVPIKAKFAYKLQQPVQVATACTILLLTRNFL